MGLCCVRALEPCPQPTSSSYHCPSRVYITLVAAARSGTYIASTGAHSCPYSPFISSREQLHSLHRCSTSADPAHTSYAHCHCSSSLASPLNQQGGSL